MHHQSGEDRDRLVSRLRDILAMSPHDEAVVVDTSPTRLDAALPCKYVWTGGWNIFYGGAINHAVSIMKSDKLVYFSVKRGKAHESRWVEEITAPLDDEKCGMAGTLAPCQLQVVANDLDGTAKVHVQGGLWAARREVLLTRPYSPHFPQCYSDVWMSWKLQRDGFRLSNVPSVRAVAGGVIKDPFRYSFAVDYTDHWASYGKDI